ncbi:MAG: phosphatidylglycerol lysyltransferase domain-containing protein [Synergistaceae bacterium]|nr:phosphatidylglycerol lysyltransferase domain-containing protein [Synergistaceae bacterium]
MRLLFKSVNLDTITPYMELWKKTQQKSSDYSSGVLLCWKRALGYQFAFEEDEELAWIRGETPERHYLAPVGRWARPDWGDMLRARFDSPAVFQLVPEALLDIWREQLGDAVQAEENRASWEYLHHTEDLSELSGNKYVKKRNRINQFVKQNPYKYLTITEDLLPRIAEFQEKWCESYRAFSQTGSIEMESDGIIRNILGNWPRLPQLLGGALEVMGDVVAYTIAENVGDEILMIHFEKASLEFNAAYQVINHEFLLHEGRGFSIVNREEDMDDPGLRDAKMSYHPTDFIKKYTVSITL